MKKRNTSFELGEESWENKQDIQKACDSKADKDEFNEPETNREDFDSKLRPIPIRMSNTYIIIKTIF